jgi:hypothetical protein
MPPAIEIEDGKIADVPARAFLFGPGIQELERGAR